MDPRVSLITLGVADLARAIRFYRDGLGLPMRESPPGVAFFETRGTWLSLFPREELAKDAGVPAEGSGFRGFALAHNVRTEAEVDATLALAVAAGATLMKPGQRGLATVEVVVELGHWGESLLLDRRSINREVGSSSSSS